MCIRDRLGWIAQPSFFISWLCIGSGSRQIANLHRWVRNTSRFTAERRSSMSRRIWCSAMGLAVLAFNLNFAHAASDDVFKGNTVKIVVGLTAGGAFDAYARTLARYLGKHIPGNPTFVVDNMPGAGGLVAANYVY